MFILPNTSILALATLLTLTMPLTSRRVGPRHGVFKAISRVINEEKIKQRIMRGLNLTTNQATLPGSPRDLPTKFRPRMGIDLTTSNCEPITIYSRTTEIVRPGTFSFPLDSKVRSDMNDIQTFKLVLHLRGARDSKMRGKTKGRDKSSRRYRRRLRKASGSTQVARHSNRTEGKRALQLRVEEQSRRWLPAAFNQSDVDEDSKLLITKTTRSRDRPRRTMKRRRQRKTHLKIVVRSIMPGNKWKRKIVVGKIKLHRFGMTTLNLRLPRHVIKDAAQTADHTLTLEIICKRCGRRIHLDGQLRTMPGTKDAEDKGNMELNPYRPYLFMQYKDGFSKARSRRRRELPSRGFYKDDKSFLNPWEEFAPSTCYSEHLWVTFEELGLHNLILYPEGFSTDVCRGTCLRRDAPWAFPSSTWQPSLVHYKSTSSISSPMSSSGTVQGDNSKAEKKKPREHLSEPTPSHRQPLSQPGRENLGHHESIEHDEEPAVKENTPPQCEPLYQRPLLLWYIDPVSKEIIPKEIPDLIQKSCICID